MIKISSLLLLSLALCLLFCTLISPHPSLVTPSASSTEEVASTLREALAQDPTVLASTPIDLATPILTATTTPKGKVSVTSVSVKQSYIWVSIILAVVLFFAVMSLLLMDSGAEKDTILYAKFLRVGEVGGQ